jgi:hypothetical protein
MVNRVRRALLVVLPAIRWQGLAPVDQSGDGLPDTLPKGRAVALDRLNPFLNGGLAGLAKTAVPLVKLLSGIHQSVEFTTDTAFAQGRGPQLLGHRGVVFIGSTWLPAKTLAGVRSWALTGGRVLDVEPDDLRRTINIAGALASKPSKPLAADALGGVRAEPIRTSGYLSTWKDEIGLFLGVGGPLYAPSGWIGTARVESPGVLVAAAGPAQGTAATAAWRLGKGLVIHTGITDFPATALIDAQLNQLLANAVHIAAGRNG